MHRGVHCIDGVLVGFEVLQFRNYFKKYGWQTEGTLILSLREGSEKKAELGITLVASTVGIYTDRMRSLEL
jgi:hypothetical protein